MQFKTNLLMKTIFTILSIVVFLFSKNTLNAQDLNPSQWPNLKGYWKFQNASNPLKATVGNDLLLSGTHQVVNGASKYDTAIRIGIGSYYKCKHNIQPNGGGDSVNRYTLMFDFKILSLTKWHTFFQTDTNNLNDGECFIRPGGGSNPGRIGTATTGYSSDSVLPNKWYRLMISVNLGNYYRYYLNGQLILEGNNQDIDDRFALNPYFLLFADNNQEDDTIDIASVAVFDTCLSSADILKIGTIDPCVLRPMKLELGRDTSICGSEKLIKSLGNGFSYQWSTGDTSSIVTFSMQKNGSGLKTIWVKKTDINGCFLRDTFKLGIYNKPNLNLGKDSDICIGYPLKLIAGPASGNSYVWKSLPSGNVLSNVNNLSIDSSGLYTVTMSNQFACTSSDTIQVRVHDNRIKAPLQFAKKEFCQGNGILFTGITGYPNTVWHDGQAGTARFITQAVKVFYKFRDSFGCESLWSDTINTVMHQNPSKPTLRYSPDTSFCSGDSILLFTIAGYKSYQWNLGTGGYSRYIHNSGTYSVTVTDSLGCISPASNSVTAIKHAVPAKPLIEIIQGKTELCPGDSVILQSKDVWTEYYWNNSKNQKNYMVKTAGKYTLQGRNSLSCFSPVSDTVTVIYLPVPAKPIIEFSSGSSNLCPEDTAIVFSKNNEHKYFWSNSDSSRYTNISKAGLLSLRVKNTYGCISEESDSINFILRSKPSKPSILTLANDSLSSSVNAKDYRWHKVGEQNFQGGKTIKGENKKSYVLYIRDQWCWSPASDTFFFISSGIIQAKNLRDKIRIEPNPAKENFRLFLPGINSVGNIPVMISDMNGRVVSLIITDAEMLAQGFSMNVPELEAGIYIISVQTDKAIFTARLIVQ